MVAFGHKVNICRETIPCQLFSYESTRDVSRLINTQYCAFLNKRHMTGVNSFISIIKNTLFWMEVKTMEAQYCVIACICKLFADSTV